MTWLANSKVALFFVVFGLLAYLSVSNWSYRKDLAQARQQVAEQRKTLAQQAGLIATMQEQDARNRKLMAEQQQREQQLRQRGEIYQRKYQDAIKNDECARRVAPGAVLDLLRTTDTNTSSTDRPIAP
ncbi:DUF2570 family protein [Serratia sp. BIGb0163]|uniref:DUF2570 family protein n=1 Tax=Serratia sp. BIGb0163 TaxID=2940613 RepID=UPI002169D3C7|nr:DUF2570 family protein [Serratia sp. BIGb0163]MCS4265005.1 CHASE3 domain sensor protein [Serratia sp. BIGb0163]